MANAMTSASQRMARSRGFRAMVVGAGKLAGKAPIHEKTITVMTYNILAQKYAGWHQYCKPQHLQWEYRKARLLDEIESYGTDLICLQEVEAGVFTQELQPWLARRGYRGHFLARQYGENVQGPPEGVALFYRTEVFELLKHHATIFTEAPSTLTVPPSPIVAATSSTDRRDTHDPPTGPSTSTSSTPAASAAAVGVPPTTDRPIHTTASTPSPSSSSSSSSSSDTESNTDTESHSRREGLRTAVGCTNSNAGASARRRKGGGSSSTGSTDTNTHGGGAGGGRANARGAGAHQTGKTNRNVVAAALGPGSTGTATRECVGGGVSTSGAAAMEFWTVFHRRQEGAIMALLRHRPSKRLVAAAVTHLFWNPAYPDVKALQAAVLCREIASFLSNHSKCPPADVPLVLGGDFNSICQKHMPDAFDPEIPPGPDGLVSGVYSLLTRGSLPPDHPHHPASRRRSEEGADSGLPDSPLDIAGLRLASAYCMALGREPALTTRTKTFAGCLDYIFMSPQHFDVVKTLELPYKDLGQEPPYEAVRNPLNDIDFQAIPDAIFPSDHLALAAELQLKG